jgi:hypothetical protein
LVVLPMESTKYPPKVVQIMQTDKQHGKEPKPHIIGSEGHVARETEAREEEGANRSSPGSVWLLPGFNQQASCFSRSGSG